MVVNIDKFIDESKAVSLAGGFAVASVSFSPENVQEVTALPSFGTLPGSQINTHDHADAITSGLKFEFTVPENYDSGGITLTAVYAMSSAVASPNNQIVLNVGAEIADSTGGGIDTVTYASAPITVTVPDNSTDVARTVTLLTIANGDFGIGDKILFLIERLGGNVADLHTGDWQLIDYMATYNGQVAASAAIHQVENFSNTAGTPAVPGTKSSFNTLDFQEGFTHEQKFQFTVPDNWDGNSDLVLRLAYAMTSALMANVQLDLSADLASVDTGSVTSLTPATFLVATPASTDVNRTLAVYSISGQLLSPGDGIVIEISRPSSSGSDTHTGDFQLIGATIFIGQGGSTMVSMGTTFPVASITVDSALTTTESGGLLTNRGAAGTVTLTLPPGGGIAVGTNYTLRRIASFAFRVDPQAGDNLRYSGGAMAAGEYLELASNEATCRITWDGTEWLVDQESGTLTEETP
ncbi:MAG: hypothetical protein ACO3ME_09340 [Ilumatobacteraceae bacterium]